ncbi:MULTISPECIES: hypothetical protein [Aeromicrobium]|uniref:hypothetical protein n=1 Tax=Aeromicrobium TaxID=2040 RepID=UPI000700E9CD|nr:MULTISPECIES: hypothetical protein [Aeromicrobium]KQX75217.1 hypothetical protein ASD10_08530 [Aeromicrobium sp. Root472D3]MCL8252633.1 hypothetical protein [Aeromicrobium fastidiosum]
MKTFLNIMLGLVGIALVAAIYFMIKTTGGGDDEPEATPTTTKVVYMSTNGVTDNIERRLEKRTGGDLRIRCPKKVDSAIGTTFRCSVRTATGTEKIALATVTIDGPDGDFTWTSSSDALRTPSPSPTP